MANLKKILFQTPISLLTLLPKENEFWVLIQLMTLNPLISPTIKAFIKVEQIWWLQRATDSFNKMILRISYSKITLVRKNLELTKVQMTTHQQHRVESLTI